MYYFDPGNYPSKVATRCWWKRLKVLKWALWLSNPGGSRRGSGIAFENVLRLATEEDLRSNGTMRKSQASHGDCGGKIARHGLEMRLVDAEYTFDGSRVTIYFTADGRVDFRELVKDLASALKTRVELRQIGVRMKPSSTVVWARAAGIVLCQFLVRVQPVSIRMAKEQNLPLNPSRSRYLRPAPVLSEVRSGKPWRRKAP